MGNTRHARFVALAANLFGAETFALQIKCGDGLRPASPNESKGFRDMVRVVFNDVAAVEAKATERGGFEPLPPGSHEITIKRCEEKTSSNNNDGLKMLLEDHKGRTVWDTLWVTEKSKTNVLRFAQAMGCEPVSGAELFLTPESVEGRRALVTVVEEEYDGKLTARVEYMSWMPPAVPNPAWSTVLTPAEVASGVAPDDIPF